LVLQIRRFHGDNCIWASTPVNSWLLLSDDPWPLNPVPGFFTDEIIDFYTPNCKARLTAGKSYFIENKFDMNISDEFQCLSTTMGAGPVPLETAYMDSTDDMNWVVLVGLLVFGFVTPIILVVLMLYLWPFGYCSSHSVNSAKPTVDDPNMDLQYV